jgi:peptidoglycan/LPS O-acetylase OafA/YrhL
MTLNAAKSRSPGFLAPLAVFRFIAAMTIVVFHTILHGHYYLRSAVSFFYVLSGFILIYVHPEISGWIPTLRFWISRLGRIWPLHLFTLAFAIIHLSVGNPVELFLNFFLLQAWVPIEHVIISFNGVSWSLSVEMFFYLVFPFLLPLVVRAPARMVMGTIALTLFLVVGAACLSWPANTYGKGLSYQDFVVFNPVVNLYKFVAGMAVGIWWRATRPQAGARAWTLIEIVVFAGVLAAVPLSDTVARMVAGPETIHVVARQLQDFLCIPFFGLLIYVFAYQKGALAQILSHPWLVFLGDISFSVYMLQWMFLLIRAHIAGSALAWLAYLATLIFCSALTYLCLERPARRFVNRLGDRLLKKVVAVPAAPELIAGP